MVVAVYPLPTPLQVKRLNRTVGAMPALRVACLGPEATSSEQAALAFIGRCFPVFPVELQLFGTFPELKHAVDLAVADYAVVPAASKEIRDFYFDLQLQKAYLVAFPHPTPPYGVVTQGNAPIDTLPPGSRLVTHEAPLSLVEQLGRLVPGVDFSSFRIDLVSSTSVAAQLVAEGAADLAITNEQAARKFGLAFQINVGPTDMDWVVFVRKAIA
jgi:bacilysin biosynthesis protein BacA